MRRPPHALVADDEQSLSAESDDEDELQLLTDDLQHRACALSADKLNWPYQS